MTNKIETTAPAAPAIKANIKYRALEAGKTYTMITNVKDAKGRDTKERRPSLVTFLGAGYSEGAFLATLPEPKASTGLHFYFKQPDGTALTADVDVGTTGTALLWNKQRVSFQKPTAVEAAPPVTEPATQEPVSEQIEAAPVAEIGNYVDMAGGSLDSSLTEQADAIEQAPEQTATQEPVAETKVQRRVRLKAEREAAEAAKTQEPVAEQAQTEVPA